MKLVCCNLFPGDHYQNRRWIAERSAATTVFTGNLADESLWEPWPSNGVSPTG
jgi:hypothetical protein